MHGRKKSWSPWLLESESLLKLTRTVCPNQSWSMLGSGLYAIPKKNVEIKPLDGRFCVGKCDHIDTVRADSLSWRR